MLLLILLLPLYNFILSLSCSKALGSKGVITISLFNLIIGFYYIIQIFYNIIESNGFYIYESSLIWIKVGLFEIKWNLFLDSITIMMLFVVYLISILVHIYSTSYMKYDPQFIRFFSLLSLFTFFMVLLVMSYNLVELFLGWEGVGLCSYLLINFWFTRIQANKAAIKAMLVNKIGDSFLIIAIILIYYVFSSVDYLIIFGLIEDYKYLFIIFYDYSIHYYTIIALCLLIAAMGKSAQIGLHTWLPDAMEGPTPVSALIHAATMVTAGVFLIIRMNCIFEYAFNYVSMIMIIVGAITALFGSIVAIVQNDIKKIIAYSTCSQLGYMFVACGFFRYDIALFHLVNHAFFKALLFLAAGLLIYMYSDEQDIRRMGGLNKLLSYIYIMMLFGSYALMGLPYFSGFYSKEAILEISLATNTEFGFFIYIILILAALCTAIYSTRMLHLVFFGKPRGFFIYYKNIKDYDLVMSLVLLILWFFSIFSGLFFKDLLVGFGSDFLFFIQRYRIFIDNYYNYEFLDLIYKLIPLFINILGILFYFIFNFIINKIKLKNPYIIFNNIFYKFLVNKWYFDYIYNYFFVKSILNFSYEILYKNIEKNYLEIIGPNFIYKFLNKISKIFDYLNFVSLFEFITAFFLMISLTYLIYYIMIYNISYDYLIYFLNYIVYIMIYKFYKKK